MLKEGDACELSIYEGPLVLLSGAFQKQIKDLQIPEHRHASPHANPTALLCSVI
jgi:hypothetical protein